ncbi:response regulator transcription factor [Paracoccus homiensis]|uniref:Two-component response regulator, FixJ family, consists of REC and HTH domains n=1 Tax=Paracoccus homiensis TaxID=364199 RepID=A0A1H9Z4C1_9RHOB|nr:response regulator [Paracoccus homiensis]SES76339.1 Two-component response regulator, FixJ family, consists of REC and HTH domains [Paracoccus homiensis]
MTGIEQTVFIVDDDAAIRVSLSRALTRRGYRVECHESAASFLATYTGMRQGCLVLDYGMPGMNGLELQDRLRHSGHTLPIIFVTGHGGVPESVRAIKAGAIDFLQKPFSQSQLVERIDQALAISREQAEQQSASQQWQARFDRLTPREREIAEFILSNPSLVSNKQIAADLGISPRTVEHHRARIFEKLEVSSVAELIGLSREGETPTA